MSVIFSVPCVVFGLAPPPAGEPEPAPWYLQLAPFVLLMVVFYVLLIRLQQVKAKQHAKLISSLRPKDKVVTSSGIVGEIVTVKERTITVRSGDTKLELLKSAVVEVTERGSDQNASKD
ncbi:MAG: preprotein translocase subunit YajC [Verrucomicrobiae bacterium]|nr:preprotein translocase subunit YajC [Verrucomicrobiae bacterium]